MTVSVARDVTDLVVTCWDSRHLTRLPWRNAVAVVAFGFAALLFARYGSSPFSVFAFVFIGSALVVGGTTNVVPIRYERVTAVANRALCVLQPIVVIALWVSVLLSHFK